jgi:hypothetical protein
LRTRSCATRCRTSAAAPFSSAVL